MVWNIEHPSPLLVLPVLYARVQIIYSRIKPKRTRLIFQYWKRRYLEGGKYLQG